ncbi:hypothetical protein AcW1_008516 [Taiwanofungus camphoratus]|nr:hypothetical protein AcW1_008516 [Antrodia cinnamomea]
MRRGTTLLQMTVSTHMLSTSGRYLIANENPNLATSSGGYGARAQDAWSNTAQRGHPDVRGSPRTNLVDQSPSGGSLGQEMQDAQQGQDDRARRQFAHEAGRDFGQGAQGLNPYGRNVDSKAEAAGFLASGYSDQRMNQFESGAAKGNDEDVGAF